MTIEAQTTRNPFAVGRTDEAAPTARHAAAAAMESRDIAETKAAMAAAKMFPRDPVRAMDRILNACARPSLAEQSLYSFSRGGQEITGPSIRLAEAIAQQWGNLAYGSRVLSTDPTGAEMEAFCWDLETNTRRSVVWRASSIRNTKRGSYALTDERDIYENQANQAARRVRSCILAVIPGDVVEAATTACGQTIEADVAVTPAMLAKLEETFAGFGVTRAALEAKIQRRLESIQPAQVVSLRKIATSLRDGMSKPEDWFEVMPPPPAAAEGKAATFAEKVAGKATEATA